MIAASRPLVKCLLIWEDMGRDRERALSSEDVLALACDYEMTRFRIVRASVTLSPMTLISRGDGREMFSSLASRTAAIIAAAMTIVEANRSLILASSSRAVARCISPMNRV